MAGKKIISIIIATYNASSTLKSCLDSIVSQLNNLCELIIIDGGSSDGTLGIIDKYKKDIVFFISERDSGLYDAWNKGIAHATGDWIMFIGADDELLPNALSSYLNKINDVDDIHTYDYICAHNNYLDLDGKIIKQLGAEPSWNKMRFYMRAAHVASLHNKKNLFETIGNYNLSYKICADYELLLRKRSKLKYLFIPNTIANVKTGGVSISSKAIYETFSIRKHHKTINLILNYCLLIKSLLLYKFFNFYK